MQRISAFFIVLTILATGLPRSAHAWSGPQVTLVNKNGRKVIQICDQGGGCTTSTPFFLALVPNSWTISLYEARLALSTLSPSQNGVVPIVQVNMGITPQSVADVASHLSQLSPTPYLYLRFYLDVPPGQLDPTTGQPLESMKIKNLQDDLKAETPALNAPFALSEGWLEVQVNQVNSILQQMDALYPGRVIGVNVGYQLAGEWFFRPTEFNAATGQVAGVGADGVFPWTGDSGTQPGRLHYYLSDYSTSFQTNFCNWGLLPASLKTGCRAATVVERNNATPGQPLPALGTSRGVFLDPADPGSLRAAWYNRSVSQQNVDAIIRILTQAKQTSGNRILTSAFYGYLNDMNYALPISGHTALSALLASSAIDIVAGPYSYDISRALDNAFLPQGIPDSPRVNNKLWFDEDDTRTHLASPSPGVPVDVFQKVFNLWDSIRVLRRNILSSGLRGHGSWFLDLPGTGWFGRPDMDSDSRQLWANLTAAFSGVNKIQLNAPNRFDAQVAIFTDDLSSNYMAGLTPAGENSFSFMGDLGTSLTNTISQLGTPVKQYLLSDLLNPNLDLSSIKLAVFANAWNVPTSVRQAIDAKLKTSGRTLVFIYAAGYLNQDAAASVTGIISLTGINVALGSGTPALGENFNVRGQNVAGGPAYSLTPWFKVSDAAAATLATYVSAGGASLARKSIAGPNGTWTSVFAAAPKLPLEVLRMLSEDAGVFHFADKGDVVEAAGNMMVLHATTTGFKTIRFPQAMSRILETALPTADTPMCSNCSSLTQLPFNDGDTRAFRWTSAPIGNFELISGTTVQGWAADLDVPDQSIAINIYIGGPFGLGGSFFAGFGATTPRPDVGAAFGIAPSKGFSQALPSCPSGQPPYAYALDPESPGDGSTLIGSHTCP
jgi:hypothetical protein